MEKKPAKEKDQAIKDLAPKADDVKGGIASSVLKKRDDTGNAVISKI